eukprot:1157056-Pelagomonas_calceolata.AAC.5
MIRKEVQCPLEKILSCKASNCHHSCSGSIRRRRRPLQWQWKGASGSPSSHKNRTNEHSGRGTAWEEQANTYVPVSAQLLIAANYSVLNRFIVFRRALSANRNSSSCVVDAQLCKIYFAGVRGWCVVA